jgi:hypothetical protein
MRGNHHNPPIGAEADSMAALGAYVREPYGLQNADDLTDWQVRQGWAHAAPATGTK